MAIDTQSNENVPYILIFPLGPDDYTILSEQLTFNSGSTSGTTMCRDIQIQQDNLSEDIESFEVILTVDSSSQTVTVLIFDDDGSKSYWSYYVIAYQIYS